MEDVPVLRLASRPAPGTIDLLDAHGSPGRPILRAEQALDRLGIVRGRASHGRREHHRFTSAEQLSREATARQHRLRDDVPKPIERGGPTERKREPRVGDRIGSRCQREILERALGQAQPIRDPGRFGPSPREVEARLVGVDRIDDPSSAEQFDRFGAGAASKIDRTRRDCRFKRSGRGRLLEMLQRRQQGRPGRPVRARVEEVLRRRGIEGPWFRSMHPCRLLSRRRVGRI